MGLLVKNEAKKYVKIRFGHVFVCFGSFLCDMCILLLWTYFFKKGKGLSLNNHLFATTKTILWLFVKKINLKPKITFTKDIMGI